MIKVGDWVNWKGMVTRVLSIQDDMSELYTGNGQRCEYAENLQKLPIKFKPFEINKHGQVYVCRYCKSIGKTYQFVATNYNGNFLACFMGYKRGYLSLTEKNKEFTTIDKAKDWLELQYATLIAKARGMV